MVISYVVVLLRISSKNINKSSIQIWLLRWHVKSEKIVRSDRHTWLTWKMPNKP